MRSGSGCKPGQAVNHLSRVVTFLMLEEVAASLTKRKSLWANGVLSCDNFGRGHGNNSSVIQRYYGIANGHCGKTMCDH